MNKKSWMVLRIVAGLYLVFLGVQIISQVTREQPNNLALMICAAVLFIGVGVVYAGVAISSVWKMSRGCLLYTSPSPRDISGSRMPSSA